MMHDTRDKQPGGREPWVVLTGATGLLGSFLLHELLSRDHRVLCIIRAATPAQARERLATAAAPWRGDIEPDFESGRLAVVRGDLHEPRVGLAPEVIDHLKGTIATVLHAAGSIAFQQRADGEPQRTNVDGTRELLRVATAWGCRDWHLVSTAFVCGHCDSAVEEFHDEPPAFRNAYEQSKWTGEQLARARAATCGARLTVHRPGVIVGHSQTGATTGFTGIYYLFRAIGLLAQASAQYGDFDRHHIPLRIPADAAARPNLMCVDDVAREIVDILETERNGHGVFHITHPKPPSNRIIKRVLEQCLDVAGGSFIGTGAVVPVAEASTYEQMFTSAMGAVAAYVLESPRFDRAQTDRLVRRRPAPWNAARLARLIAFGQKSGWRINHRSAATDADGDGCAAYFERFLPEHIADSRMASLAGLDLDVRYVIEGVADGDWLCRFRGGRLHDVGRTQGQGAAVTYRIAAPVFWDIVGGQASASELFLAGHARVEGDIERALKFANIVQDFVQEFPFDRQCQQRADA
ncbi:MAG TPA: SDR family oxidoreductase [Phycisphaerae bacterium]|nr:SDR family oxidoreductase [Phycisphaerales bacterium]HRX86019.1 SDR family oxidoreductase [Phycisphaerae bacterium]